MWNNTVELAKLEITVNENGVEEESFKLKEVFCDEKSVTSDEYYKSTQVGEEIKVVLEIKQVDYEKEPYLIYEGETYKVVRTYKTGSENIELHCSLKEGLYE